MTAPSPGPAPDRAAAERLEQALQWVEDGSGWENDHAVALAAEAYRRGVELDRARRALAGHLFDGESLSFREAVRNELIEEGLRTAAELDRQRGLIAAVLARCERVERDPGKFNVMATFEIRALLGGEKR